MPIVSVVHDDPFTDGRQSERALTIRTGVERYFSELGRVFLAELSLASGRRADLVALSPKGRVTIVEVKSSIADFRADTKWTDYRQDCDELLFATLSDVPADIFPQNAGLMIADNYGAELLRSGPETKLSAARRKAIHLRFARASAARLARCCAYAGLESSSLADNDEL